MTIDYRKEVEGYKAEMTEAERMEKYMKGEEVDHLPFGLLSSDECFANLLGYTTTDMREDFDIMCKVIDFRIKEYGLHGIGVGLGLRTLGYVAGSKPYYPENGVDHVDEFRFSRGVDLDVDSLKTPDPYNDEVMTPMLDLAKKLKERFPDGPFQQEFVLPYLLQQG